MSATPGAAERADAGEFPVRLAGDEAFAAARELFARAGFTDLEVVRRLGIRSIYDFEARRAGRPSEEETRDAFELLVRLFMDSEPAAHALVRRLLGGGGEATLRELGLLRDTADGGRCRATVLLYPTEGLLVASDLPHEVAEPGDALGADVVYPAVTGGTGHYLGMIPRTPCERFLELCGGTGIAALVASRFAGHAWATDITARATHFAEFNRRLNGIANVTAARGDLYEAVPGLDFDRIVAHPPYVAAPEVTQIFRDGGEDGEQVTRAIIAGLPAHLRPGGTLHLTGAVTDRRGRRFEERVRELLGEAAGEFDVFFLSGQGAPPAEHFLVPALKGQLGFDELEQRVRLFERLDVERIVYGSLVVRRHRSGERRAPITARRRAMAGADESAARTLIRIEDEATAPAYRETFLERRMMVSPSCELAVTHRPTAEGWEAMQCVLHATEPFVSEARMPAAAAELLVRLDGSRTAREALREAREAGLVPPELDEATATDLLVKLVAMGLVVLEPGG